MPNRRFIALAAFPVSLGLVAPALASSRHAPQRHGGAAAPYAHASIPTKKSTSFAGYDINSKDGMMDVTTTIVVPKLKCTMTDRAIGVSVGLYENSKKNFSSANLFIGCVKGKARYFPFLTLNRHEQNLRALHARPGDMVTLEADANGTETVVEVNDQTHPFDTSKTGAPYHSFVGYPWVGDVTWSRNGKAMGVPNFGKIHFRTATLDGSPFGSIAHQRRFNRYNKTKTTLQIKTGQYGPSKQAFGSTFRHS